MLVRALVCGALVWCAALPANAQDQRSGGHAGWPCSGRVDPAFIRTAEATGGKVFLFTPIEVSGVADDLSASSQHRETVVRATGQLDDGVHEFEIPLDSTIHSAYFFVSLQCLQFVTIVRPSGDALPADAPDVDYHVFDAVHLVTIKSPSPGTWKVRMAGRGFFSVIVSAMTDLALTRVALTQDGLPVKGVASGGKPAQVEVTTSGSEIRQVAFRFISLRAAMLRRVALDAAAPTAARRTYAGEVTLPETDFRILMTGIDANGFPFQRVTPHVFLAGTK
jgi:hypothetical protein